MSATLTPDSQWRKGSWRYVRDDKRHRCRLKVYLNPATDKWFWATAGERCKQGFDYESDCRRNAETVLAEKGWTV